jgi:RNA polymerase sigma-70 factor, ECF subfamily
VPADATVTNWFVDHRTYLWGLAYRITGSAPDADDVLQETFVRAWERAPSRLDDPRRWLTKVAVNVARDVLRRRKRRRYIGPWLPTPVATDERDPPSFEPVVEGETLEGRFDLIESASLAFLQALEALTPTQRAVLLLRDVFDYSAAEVAAVLDLSAGNVRIIHLRARRLMSAYERRRVTASAISRARTGDTLRHFLALLAKGDVRGIERMLAADVRAVTDGGGEYTASRRPVLGVARVAQFFARLAASRPGNKRVTIRSVNAFPAALFEFTLSPGRRAPKLLLALNVDEAGRITNLWVIASSEKLGVLARPPQLAFASISRADGGGGNGAVSSLRSSAGP